MKHFAGALAVIALGGLGLYWVFGTHDTVRAYLDKNCQYTGTTNDENGNKAREYDCPHSPSKMTEKLREVHKPASIQSSPAGNFLRYSNDMVGILGAGAALNAARVLLSDQRNGYGLFNNYVGGWWGTHAGPGEAFRGGGPGAGK